MVRRRKPKLALDCETIKFIMETYLGKEPITFRNLAKLVTEKFGLGVSYSTVRRIVQLEMEYLRHFCYGGSLEKLVYSVKKCSIGEYLEFVERRQRRLKRLGAAQARNARHRKK